jgi:hypothetical protein
MQTFDLQIIQLHTSDTGHSESDIQNAYYIRGFIKIKRRNQLLYETSMLCSLYDSLGLYPYYPLLLEPGNAHSFAAMDSNYSYILD